MCGSLTVLEIVASLARDKESLLRDSRSEHAMSAPSLLGLKLGSEGMAEIVRSAGL